MKIDEPAHSFADILPELRQFSFIMTGDEEAADAALEEALKSALDCVDAAHGFPCHRSWLFAHLLQALKRSSSSATPDLGIVAWVSLLQIPPEERAVLVLAEGFDFDLVTTSLITGRPRQKTERLLSGARQAFYKLSADYGVSQERELSLQ
jgi:DNA-directed RNA polymerase specialized sigma24 family protein